VSGCGLSPKCWRDFPFMKELDLPNMRVAEMATAHFVDKHNKELINMSFSPSESAEYEEARKFLTTNVYRSELDPWLASLAVEMGAELRTSTLATGMLKSDRGKILGIILEDGTKLSADVVIGADGIISTTAISAGLRNRWEAYETGLIIQYDYKATREKIDEVIGSNALHYWYSATFPVAYTFFNANGFHAGLGGFLEWWDKSPLYYLDTFLQVEGIQRQIRLTEAKPREYQAHMLPFLSRPGKTYADNLMLVGDAAGFACPLEAEGVYYAMLSGKIAAEVGADSISSGDTSELKLVDYEKRWKNSPIGDEFEAGPEISNFLRDLAFNPKPGEWITPFLNDVMFGICNVANSHVANWRDMESELYKYSPYLLDVLLRDFLPIIGAINKPHSKEISRPLKWIGNKFGSFLLPRIARRIGSQKDLPLDAMRFLIEQFVEPLIEARMDSRYFKERGGK